MPQTARGPLSVLWATSRDDTASGEVALADLTGDGVSEVVVVMRSGALAVLDGRDGRTWRSWPIGAAGSPLIEDLNGDGLLELCAPADSAWVLIETGALAYPGNAWPTWRGDAGRRGLREVRAAWPPEVVWSLAAFLILASAACWTKS
jgi:hypothetical protein